MKALCYPKKLAGFVGAFCLLWGSSASAQPTKLPAGETILPVSQKDAKGSTTEKLGTPQTVEQKGTVITFDGPADNNRGLNIGLGFYLISPYWGSNEAYRISASKIVDSKSISTLTTTDFDFGCAVAPRVFAHWIGDSGLGFRAGWWHYDQIARESVAPPSSGKVLFAYSSSFGGTTGTYFFSNRVNLDVWDFDITAQLQDNDRWSVLVGAGIRYAYMLQTYYASEKFTGSTTTDSYYLERCNMFNGAGPNAFIEARRFLGNSRLALYGNARFGVLFGDGRAESESISGESSAYETVAARENDVLPFLDTEAGVEWIGSGNRRAQPFIRIGVVGQAWFGAGNGSSAYDSSSATGRGGETNLGFFGFSFLGGFIY